jgi:hypothetical protein
LPLDPVLKLSRIFTSSPLATNASQRWEPIKPAPPVISTRTIPF